MLISCPAKINTFLAVGPPDNRGWHPLRTIFQEVDLCDTLTVETAAEEMIEFSVPGIPLVNSVSTALRLLREHVAIPSLKISVDKKIPAQSGLGGGSSDAAGILRQFGKELPAEQRMEIASRVGADVPFFLVGGRAMAEGYGERLNPLPDLPVRWLVLARPEEGCPTPEMFRLLDEKPREFREFPTSDVLYNDFERVAPCASLDLMERLQVYGADDAGLTGSGSVVFGRFPDESSARIAAKQMKAEASWVAVTRTNVT